MRVFGSGQDLAAAVGEDLGVSGWMSVDQARVDLFAEATGDFQWIHVDVERAANGPFGGTIAHGLLTLSLLPVLMRDTYRVDGARIGLNYGYGKVRFMTPVRTGMRLRAAVSLMDVTETPRGFRTVMGVVGELEGAEKPACAVESISLWTF